MNPKEYEKLYMQMCRVAPPAKIFLYGEDSLLKDGLTRGILSRTPKELSAFNSDIIWMDSHPEPKEIFDIIISPPMMANCRVVVLRNFKISRSPEKKITEGLFKIQFPSTTILVVESDELDLKTEEGKKISELFDIHNVPQPKDKELIEWAIFLARREKKKISIDNAGKLVEIAGTSLGILREEIQKLCLSIDGDDILANHINEIVAKSRVAHIFQFSNSVILLDFRTALKIAQELTTFGENYAIILNWVQRDIVNLLRAKIDAKSLTKKLGARSFLSEKISKSASMVKVEKLWEAIDVIHQADMLVKSGKATENTALVWALGMIQSLLSER